MFWLRLIFSLIILVNCVSCDRVEKARPKAPEQAIRGLWIQNQLDGYLKDPSGSYGAVFYFSDDTASLFSLHEGGVLDSQGPYSIKSVYGSTIYLVLGRGIFSARFSDNRKNMILEEVDESIPERRRWRSEFNYHGPDLPDPWKQNTVLDRRGRKAREKLLESLYGLWQSSSGAVARGTTPPFVQVTESTFVFIEEGSSADLKIPYRIWSAYGSTIFFRAFVKPFGKEVPVLFRLELSEDRRRLMWTGDGKWEFSYRGKSAPQGVVPRKGGGSKYSKERELASASGGANTPNAQIAIVNPDSYRIVKFGLLVGPSPGDYYSIAHGEVADECDGGYTNLDCWTGFGGQQDFIGTVLSNSGYTVAYFTPDNLPPVTPADYQVLIVQDPLKTNARELPKDVENTLPDLLEYVLSQSFIDKLKTYFDDGGNIILVGDAVKLLEDGEYRLNFGKTINTDIISNILSNPDSCVPSKWLFIRGNPFCGKDRSGSATYSVETSVLLPTGTKLSDITLFDGNDLPQALTWSDVVYYPNDGISLLDVRVQGTGQYVLRGDICDPPVYTVTVDDVLSNFMGYTLYDGKKIFYIGSDTYFDYDFVNHDGAWHAGQYLEMKYTVTDAGKQAILTLIDSIPGLMRSPRR